MADPTFKDLAYRGLAAALGGPVDLTTMVMRPFGYNKPDAQIVGGSEWIGQKMQDTGMVSSSRSPLQEFLASMAIPTPGGIAKGAAAMALPAMAGMTRMGKAEDALNSKTLYRGLQNEVNPNRTNTIDWYSETPELANIYGKNIITKPMPENLSAVDLGFRDYMTEVKQSDVVDKVKQAVVDSFNTGKINKETALEQFDKLKTMQKGDDFKRVHEWIMENPKIADILKNSGYNAISHIDNGNQTYGLLNTLK